MTDRSEDKVRAFVIELLNDPPQAPPFPDPSVVVIKGDRSTRRELMTDTRTREPGAPAKKRSRGPLVAVGAFAAVLVVAISAFVLTTVFDGDSEPEVAAPVGPASLPGNAWSVTGGLAAQRPDRLEFDQDGIFRVVGSGLELDQDGNFRVVGSSRTLDTGTYQIADDVISFVSVASDPIPGKQAGVVWWDQTCQGPEGTGGGCMGPVHFCEGLVGDYRIVFDGLTRFTLGVVFDECIPRVTVANGLQLELLTD